MSNKSSTIHPSKVNIHNFFISVDNDTTRKGTIYANGVMQAVVYIHYSYGEGESSPNIAVENYIKEHIAFYKKENAPQGGAARGMALSFNVEGKPNQYINDLHKTITDSSNSRASVHVAKIYFTVDTAGEYSNIQPYVNDANHVFNHDTVMSLEAKSFNITKENVQRVRDHETNHSHDGISDLWSVKYVGMPDGVKLKQFSGFDKPSSGGKESTGTTKSGNYKTETGTDIKNLSGANCLILFSGESDKKMILGYAPEYYGASGHPAPYFGNSSSVDASTYVDRGYRSGHLYGGEYTHSYPANDYSETIKNRYEVGKVYLFGIKSDHGPYFCTSSSTGTLVYRFNQDSTTHGFNILDNAGNKIRVKFWFDGDWDKDRDYMGVEDAYTLDPQKAEVVA